MYKVLRPIADAYVTNRYIDGVSQVTANVGAAGSLDLFKLYGYTSTASGSFASGSISGSTYVPSGPFTAVTVPNTELSRLLVQFDLSPIRTLVSQGTVDPGNKSFSCKLHLFDVYGGQPTPSNFTINVFPLVAGFTEGLGNDVVTYSDFDVCNWLTSSYASGSWVVSGCGSGSTGLGGDYLTTYQSSQFFPKGTEDLCIDVTSAVSATLAGLIPDEGFRVSYSPALETDTHSYFVKRFASRTAYNSELSPQLIVRFDNSVQDDTDNLFLDSTSYLFLYNYVRSSPANLTSGSSSVTGLNCLHLSFVGDFPAANYGTVSSSIVVAPIGTFAFLGSSSVAFSGTLSSSAGGISATLGSQLVGSLVGGYAATQLYVPSGSFVDADGLTAVLSGTSVFTGTLGGIPGTYALTGTYVPNGSFLFSGTYAISSTLGPVPYTVGPFLGSQLFLGTNPQTGIYSASVLLSSTDPGLLPQWQFSGSVSLTPVWGSLDGTVAYLTGSAIKAYPPQRGPQSLAPRNLTVSVLGLHDDYNPTEVTTLRVNIFDYTQPYLLNALRLPVELPGIVIRDVHYQIRDVNNGLIAVPFDTVTNSTRLSNDAAGMFFGLDVTNLTCGHTYVIDVLVITDNNQQLYRGASSPFRVVVAT